MIVGESKNTPVFTNPFSNAREYILSRFLIGIIVITAVRLLSIFLITLTTESIFSLINFLIDLIVLCGLIAVFINKQWPYELRASLLLVTIYIFAVESTLVERLVPAIGHIALVAFSVLAFILIDNRTGIISTGLSIFTILAINFSSRAFDNQLLVNFYLTPAGFILTLIVFLVVGSALILAIDRLLRGIQQAIEQEQELAQTLEEEGALLEKRIEARQKALLTTTQVNQALTQLLEEQEIASTAVNEIRAAFEVLHVQLYKLDKQEGDLKLQAATGHLGASLMDQAISLTIGFGPIGKAAVSQEIVTVFQPSSKNNQHILPETDILLAMPIMYEQELYGILLIQHDDRQAINEDINYALKLISDQIALTLRNAQQYRRAQKLLRHEELVNSIRAKIQQAETIEEVLQTAAAELGNTLNAPKTFIKIGRERRNI